MWSSTASSVKPDIGNRLPDSLETGAEAGRRHRHRGKFAEKTAKDGERAERIVFSAKFACPVSGFTIPEIEPRLFSFNNPFGACPCDGLGVTDVLRPRALIVPDEELSLKEGAVAPWAKATSPLLWQTLEALAKHYNLRCHAVEGPAEEGARRRPLRLGAPTSLRSSTTTAARYETKKTFRRRDPQSRAALARDRFSARGCARSSRSTRPEQVRSLHGFRLKPEALAVKIAARTSAKCRDLSIRAATSGSRARCEAQPKQKEIAARILKEINERLASW
jgi:excinuclease ABC subunit A